MIKSKSVESLNFHSITQTHEMTFLFYMHPEAMPVKRQGRQLLGAPK